MNDRVWADLQALFEYGELIWENEEPVLSSRAGRVQGFTDELEALRLILQVNERRNCCSYTAGTSAGVNSDVHVERGHLDQLATYWPALAGGSASFQVGKDYHWGGVVGTFNDLVKDIVTLGGGALGATLGFGDRRDA